MLSGTAGEAAVSLRAGSLSETGPHHRDSHVLSGDLQRPSPSAWDSSERPLSALGQCTRHVLVFCSLYLPKGAACRLCCVTWYTQGLMGSRAHETGLWLPSLPATQLAAHKDLQLQQDWGCRDQKDPVTGCWDKAWCGPGVHQSTFLQTCPVTSASPLEQ